MHPERLPKKLRIRKRTSPGSKTHFSTGSFGLMCEAVARGEKWREMRPEVGHGCGDNIMNGVMARAETETGVKSMLNRGSRCNGFAGTADFRNQIPVQHLPVKQPRAARSLHFFCQSHPIRGPSAQRGAAEITQPRWLFSISFRRDDKKKKEKKKKKGAIILALHAGMLSQITAELGINHETVEGVCVCTEVPVTASGSGQS